MTVSGRLVGSRQASLLLARYSVNGLYSLNYLCNFFVCPSGGHLHRYSEWLDQDANIFACPSRLPVASLVNNLNFPRLGLKLDFGTIFSTWLLITNLKTWPTPLYWRLFNTVSIKLIIHVNFSDDCIRSSTNYATASLSQLLSIT